VFCASTVLSLKETSDMVNCEDFGTSNKKFFSACFCTCDGNKQPILACVPACVCILYTFCVLKELHSTYCYYTSRY